MNKEYKNIDYRVKYFDKCVEADKIKRKYEKVVRRNERKQKNIDKAIQYIHNHRLVFELSSKEQIQEWFDKFYAELLNILRGEDK